MEYKFRGKRKDNGQWAFGSLVTDTHGTRYSIIDYANSDTETYSWHDVIPETVGMWTGLKDIEGKDIYQGDIVLTKKFWKYRFSNNKRWKRFYGLVVFETSQTTGEAGWDVVVKDQEDYDYEAYGPFDDCKVISNVTDAPHLLTPSQKGDVLNTMNITDPNAKQPDELKAEAEQIAAAESAAQDSAVGVDAEEGGEVIDAEEGGVQG